MKPTRSYNLCEEGAFRARGAWRRPAPAAVAPHGRALATSGAHGDETRIVHSTRCAGRVVFCAQDPFPEPRPFSRSSNAYRTVLRSKMPRARLSRGSVAFLCALVLIVIALTGSLFVQFALSNELESAGSEHHASTPRSEWTAGVVPYLYQTDDAWSKRDYAGSTIGIAGCGPTCLSMAYVALTGLADRDPASMSAFSQINGYVDDGLTAWTLMTEGAAKLGLSSKEIPADRSALEEAFRNGGVVIASVRPGDFTSEGHFIVIAGFDDNGMLSVRDPNSAKRSAMPWDVERVLSQCAGLWSLTRA